MQATNEATGGILSVKRSVRKNRQLRVTLRQQRDQENPITRRKSSIDSSVSSLSTNSTHTRDSRRSNKKSITNALSKVVVPVGVVDIDCNLSNNAEPYWNSIICLLFDQEVEYALPSSGLFHDKQVLEMRCGLVSWLVQVQSHCRCKPQSLHLAIFYCDRCLALGISVTTKNYQLLGAVCFFLACKIEERHAPLISKLLAYTEDSYTKPEFLAMEQTILKTLDFKVIYPTGWDFSPRFLTAAVLDVHSKQSKLWLANSTHYFMDLCLLHLDMAPVSASKRVAACILVARKLFAQQADAWSPTLQFYTRCTESQLSLPMQQIATMLINLSNGTLKHYGPKTKFSKPQHCEVSSHSLLAHRNPDLLNIAKPH